MPAGSTPALSPPSSHTRASRPSSRVRAPSGGVGCVCGAAWTLTPLSAPLRCPPVTEYPAHATEVCRGLDLRAWDAVVIVGGDGLMHEVLEGFMQREDWAEAMRLPFGVIPGGARGDGGEGECVPARGRPDATAYRGAGSGNGLAASILHACQEVYDVATSAFVVARGISTPLDVCTVATAQRVTHSFLSVRTATPRSASGSLTTHTPPGHLGPHRGRGYRERAVSLPGERAVYRRRRGAHRQAEALRGPARLPPCRRREGGGGGARLLGHARTGPGRRQAGRQRQQRR